MRCSGTEGAGRTFLMTITELTEELRGAVCRCGAAKKTRQSLCKVCYYRLPHAMRKALYQPVGSGYRQAYEDAAGYLDGLAAAHPPTHPNTPASGEGDAAQEVARWRAVALTLGERLTLMGRGAYVREAFERAGLPCPDLTTREATGRDLPDRKMTVK